MRCDVLILGSGGAGLLAALHAHRANPRLRIVLASKGLIGKSGCTRMVQGGYNAVLDSGDSLDMHLLDSLKGGGWINNQELTHTLVDGAPRMIRELETVIGCFFDRRDDGRIHQKPFAGQSFDRTVHRGDLTGIEIVGRLRDALFATGVEVLEEVRALDLLRSASDPERVAGALLLDLKRGQLVRAQARITILATGGGARMYRIAAPSLEKSGDGMAIAWRAGATLVDMEMYQFHPTGLLAGASRMTGMVLEEGLRGAGGILTNALGERYMERYDPVRLERSTRDVVSRSSYLEIVAGRGTAAGGVRLDVSHLGPAFIERNFGGMLRRCLDFGYDLRTGPVEVSPTAHFHMGGVKIDAACHSSLPGLLVAGEDAGGAHGANRLGGNGVAESTVFGAIAGETAAREALAMPPADLDAAQVAELEARALAPLQVTSDEDPFALRTRLEALMWDQVGLVRNGPGLSAALAEIEQLKARADRLGAPDFRALNLAWVEALDTRNLLDVAWLTTRGALERTESRGAHFRSDFPTLDDARWLANVYLRGNEVWTAPVPFTRLAPPVPEPVPGVTETVQLRVRRAQPGVRGVHWDTFAVPLGDRMTVLDALFHVLRESDRTLAFRCACRAAMCGSCAMVIDGSERLACRTSLASLGKSTIRVEPLRHMPVIKDLVVDLEPFFDKYVAVGPWVVGDASRTEPAIVPPSDRARMEIGEGLDCISCGACYSACPMVAADPDYLGPMQLLRAFNVLSDARESPAAPDRDEVFGRHGIWRCRGIGECTRVCPKALDPSLAIRRLKRGALLDAFR